MMRKCVEQALTGIALVRATTCLDAMAALVARGDAATVDRARLARLYLGVAEERLGRGDVDQARGAAFNAQLWDPGVRSEEHTSELQSLMRISYAVFCLKKKTTKTNKNHQRYNQLHQNITNKYT